MALVDVLTEAGNVSSIIELTTLSFIVLGFFRWYDSKYNKTITATKSDVLLKIDETKESLFKSMEHLTHRFERLEDRFNEHIRNGRSENETY